MEAEATRYKWCRFCSQNRRKVRAGSENSCSLKEKINVCSHCEAAARRLGEASAAGQRAAWPPLCCCLRDGKHTANYWEMVACGAWVTLWSKELRKAHLQKEQTRMTTEFSRNENQNSSRSSPAELLVAEEHWLLEKDITQVQLWVWDSFQFHIFLFQKNRKSGTRTTEV